MTAALGVAGPDARRGAAAPVLRGPPGGGGPRVRVARRRDVFEHHAGAWARALAGAGAADADVLHLHHLTPINAAAERVAPGVPVVGHLHGTELLMLEAIEAEPGRWAHGPAWAERMRAWAARAERLIVLSDSQVARAERLLGVDPARCVRVANGFDPETFRPRHVDHRAHWRRALVDEPRGWAPGEEAGSVRYAEADLAAFGDDRGETPVLLYVGRYTEVKRLPLLIEAYAQARAAASPAARRSCWSAASRASGRASTRSTRSAAPAPATCSSPAGTTTPSCRTSWRPPTSSCCRRCASSSGRCWSRAARAGCRRSRSTRTGPAEIVATARRAGSCRPTTATRSPRRCRPRSTTPRSARRRGERRLRGRRATLRLARARRARRRRLRRRAG